MRLVVGKELPEYEMVGRVLSASEARVLTEDCCRCVVFPDRREDRIGMTGLASFELYFPGVSNRSQSRR
jgi:hypothetical protein